jgi:hypothetical protein
MSHDVFMMQRLLSSCMLFVHHLLFLLFFCLLALAYHGLGKAHYVGST